MSDLADNIAARDREPEPTRRASALYQRSRAAEHPGERVCSLCGGHFPEQGRFNLAAHYEAAHAAAILAMPAERFGEL